MTLVKSLTSPRRVAVWLAALLVIGQAVSVIAQPPGGGPPGGGPPGGGPPGGGRGGPGGFGGFGGGGGRGFGGGGLTGLLRRDSVKAELQITAEQDAAIVEASMGAMPDFRVMGEKMRAATTDEERTKISEEMRLEGEKRRKETEEKIKKILKPEQFSRLEQLNFQDAGWGSFRDTTVTDSLKFTDDQKKKLKELQDAYDEKMRAGGFRMSGEERDKLRTERDAGIEGLLTADQKKQWESKLGPPAAKSDEVRDGGRDGGRRERTGQSNSTPRGPVREEKVPDGAAVVASLTPEEKPSDVAATVAAEKVMSFNFRYAPWELVLKHFAEHAGLTLDLNVVPPGTFNYFDDNKFTVTQALDVLNGYLSQKGFLLVRRDKFLVVVSTDAGVPPNLVPQIPVSELPKRGRFELVSVLMSLEGLDPELAADEAQELLSGPLGKIVPLSKSGRLLVTDLAGNVQRIHDLIVELGGSPVGNVPVFQSFQLKHVSVMEAEKVVRDLFGLPQRPIGGSSSVPTASSSNNPSRDSSSSRWGGGFPGGYPGGFPGGFPGGQWGGDGRDGRGGDGRDGRSSSQPSQPGQPANVSSSNARISVATDLRTNSLMITAKPEDLKVVEAALKTLDVDDKANSLARNLTGRNSPQLEVYPITTADSRVVILTINSLVPSAIVNEDAKAKRLHVFATAEDQVQIKALIAQIDGGVEGGETALVVHLRRLDPLGAAGSLRNLFKGNRDEVPMIEADPIGRRLMIRGTTTQVSEIKGLLKQMGEDPDGEMIADPGLRGPVRTLSVGNRDAREFAELLKQIWPARDSNPIRIVVPSAIAPTLKAGTHLDGASSSKSPPPGKDKSAGMIRTRVPSTGPSEAVFEDLKTLLNTKSLDQALEDATAEDTPSEPVKKEQPAGPQKSPSKTPSKSTVETEEAPASDTPPALKSDGNVPVDSEQGAGDATKGAEAEAGETSGKSVVVSPNGNSLIIASDDLEALDRLQAMAEALALAAPKGTTWTVFYLRTADATETSTMLGHLFPSGSVSQTADPSSGGFMGSITGGISSFGSNLMDMTGLSNLASSNALRIVPEIRSNALFVSGPTDLVRQVEDVLKVLDSSELPESMRDRLPRMIAVEHADVDEVAAIIESVYKDYMTAPAAMPGGGGGGGGFNPLAMLMAAGGGGDNKQKRGIRLTLGIDDRTNSIIVSADETLFRQIEELVASLDKAALDANRTIRVVNVNSANSQLMQQALSSLMGKVKVSTTRSGGGPPSIDPPQIPGGFQDGQRTRGSRGGGSGNSPEDAQRAIEQQMRQQFLQGAGLVPPQSSGGRGGRGFGGGGPGGGFGGGPGGGRQRD